MMRFTNFTKRRLIGWIRAREGMGSLMDRAIATKLDLEVELVPELLAQLADKWRDENKAAVARARKRAGLMGDDGMADMLEGAAIECNAIGQAIRARTVLGGL